MSAGGAASLSFKPIPYDVDLFCAPWDRGELPRRRVNLYLILV